MYKNNSRDSSKFKVCSPLQLSCNLTGKCHAVGYYSYTIYHSDKLKLTKEQTTANAAIFPKEIIPIFYRFLRLEVLYP